MRSKPMNRAGLDDVDGERTAVDPPARPRAQVLVVVAQVPHQVGDLPAGDGPVVSDACDPAQRIVGVVAGGIHLTNDGVFGSGYRGQRGHRLPHPLAAVVMAHRLKRSGRVG
jgi:hypothetical protein